MRIIITFVALLFTIGALAQSEKAFPIRYSPSTGAYLYFANQALAADAPFQKIAGVRISRQTGKNFKELVKLGRPSTVKEFKSICGDSWGQFLLMKKFKTDDAGWKFILAHPSMDDYGTLAFDMKFRQAMGNAFLDTEAINLPSGKQWVYKIEMLDVSGGVTHTLQGVVTGGDAVFRFGKPATARTSATDSAVFVHWFVMSKTPLNGIVMADVYRQDAGQGNYRKLPSSLLATTKGDSILFYLSDKVNPSTLYRYYIRPSDDIGNTGQASDTASVLSFNFGNLPRLEKVTATDTLNALMVRWKPLGDQPRLIGIEIQRSRDARGNYVILDTVSLSASSYHDTRVLPAIAYFYRLRLITIKGMSRSNGYAGYATGSVRNSLKNPDPPYGLTAALEKGKITLRWQAVTDPDLFAYFVYRSTSDKGKFEVISPSITTTEYTDTSSVSGRTQYVYAVQAVNKNSLVSEFSNKITMRQAVVKLPASPGGLQAYADHGKIILQWPAATLVDHAVAGYNVYRREEQPQNNFDQKRSAAAQATALKFVLLNRKLTVQPYYEDAQATPGLRYEYAISSVDVFGIEGTYSPFAKLRIPVVTRVFTTCTVRKVSTGVELACEKDMTTSADAVVVYRKKAGETKFQKIGTLAKGQLTYIDKTALKNTLYVYELRAEKGTFTLAKSDEKNFQY